VVRSALCLPPLGGLANTSIIISKNASLFIPLAPQFPLPISLPSRRVVITSMSNSDSFSPENGVRLRYRCCSVHLPTPEDFRSPQWIVNLICARDSARATAFRAHHRIRVERPLSQRNLSRLGHYGTHERSLAQKKQQMLSDQIEPWAGLRRCRKPGHNQIKPICCLERVQQSDDLWRIKRDRVNDGQKYRDRDQRAKSASSPK